MIASHLETNRWIIPAVILGGYAVFIITSFIFSSQKTNVLLDKNGIKSDKYGLINWNQIDSYFFEDTSEFKTLKLRLNDNRKINFVSRLNDSESGENFKAFLDTFYENIEDYNKENENKILEKSFYHSKYAKPAGIILLIVLTGLTIFAWGKEEFPKALIIIGISIPILIKLFTTKSKL